MSSTAQSQAIKSDKGKSRMDLIPPNTLLEVGAVFSFGALKYADRNWEKGFTNGRLAGAALRHITQWQAGENLDPESGYSHLTHAICSLMMLSELSKCPNFQDDRSQLETIK